jgi:hypothetical protein
MVSGGKLFAAAGPAIFDDPASLLGGHPFPKAVGSRPFDPAWLIRAFHDPSPFEVSWANWVPKKWAGRIERFNHKPPGPSSLNRL